MPTRTGTFNKRETPYTLAKHATSKFYGYKRLACLFSNT